MPTPNRAALDFLLTRRSRPAKTLGAPGPDRAALTELLTAAARVPDHGKLVPFRFILVDDAARPRLAALAHERAIARGEPPEKAEKAAAAFGHAGALVAVAAVAQPSATIPDWEQHMAAGNACLSLLNAALAAGWGANWLTGFTATDATFLEAAFGLAPPAFVAGYIHIGTETLPPKDRTRPDLADILTVLER